jgi:hypothetical protein
MDSDFIDEFIEKLIQSGAASFWSLRGCSESEILALEKHFGFKLPGIYRDYLSKMGHSPGKLFTGTDVSYKWLFELRDFLRKTLETDESGILLPENIFVFSSHQGYIYHFFYVVEGSDNPPVFGYKEGELIIKKINESFSDFLLDSLADFQQSS